MKITYTSNSGLAAELADILKAEGLDVSYYTEVPTEQTGEAAAAHIFEVTRPGVPAWMVIFTTAETAIARFKEQFPDESGTFEIEGEYADQNTPA